MFCKLCLQGFHIGECQTREQIVAAENSGYSVDPNRAATVSEFIRINNMNYTSRSTKYKLFKCIQKFSYIKKNCKF